MRRKITSMLIVLIIICMSIISNMPDNTVQASSTADDIVAIAEGEVGYYEKASDSQLYDKTANKGSGNYTKYWAELDSSMQGQNWCAAFIVWCARQVGIGEDVIPTSYSVYNADSSMKNWFESRGRYYTRGSTTPQKGDLIVFVYSSNEKHIGIVTGVDSSTVYTIEGNTSNMVNHKSYSLNNSTIHGYCRPAYDDSITLSINETIYAEGDTINFTTSATNASAYYLEIERNGETWTENLSDFSYTPSGTGRYNVRLVSTSSSVASNWVEFTVDIGSRSVSGDFNGDGKDDYATLFDCGNNSAQWHVFLSTGDSFSEEIWRTDGEYYVSCVGGKVVAGDFNGDGLDDVATIYRYTAHNTSVHVFLSTGSGFKSWQTWFRDTVGYPSDPIIDKVVAGDFNGDGLDDIAAIYEYSKFNTSIHVFLSTGTSFKNWETWFRDTSGYQANLVTGRVVAGDFNGDGLDDIAAVYEYSKFNTSIHVFLSTGTSFKNWETWFRDSVSYQGQMIAGRVVAGDFNGDGLDDIAAMFEYGKFKHSIHVFISEGTTLKSWSSWIDETEFEPKAVSGRFVAGDFNGDGTDDIATMFNYSNTYTIFHMYMSDKAKLNHKWWNRIDNYNVKRTTGFKNISGSYTPAYTFTHKHTYKDTIVEPTCTERGYTIHTCTKGDNTYDDNYINALGHQWSEWQIIKQATYEDAGEETRICEQCNLKETREIPVLVPTPTPTVTPTATPTATPTVTPTPTVAPTATPTATPTVTPTPTATPTATPTTAPAVVPTVTPTVKPTETPTPIPTAAPIPPATSTPTVPPTQMPTTAPTEPPTETPESKWLYFTLINHGDYTDVCNNTNEVRTVTIIVADYDKEILRGISTAKLIFDAGQTRTFIHGSDECRIFVWDSLNGMHPLAAQ